MNANKTITHLAQLLPTEPFKEQRWRSVVEHQVPDTRTVALVQGEPLEAGDVIRLYPNETQSKNPRPLIVTVESISPQEWGFALLTDKGTFGYRYYAGTIPTVRATGGKHKAYSPFRTHSGYLLWCQWEKTTHHALNEISLSLGHAGEHQLPALEQLQNLLGEYIEAVKKG